jgi:hypothetical protein
VESSFIPRKIVSALGTLLCGIDLRCFPKWVCISSAQLPTLMKILPKFMMISLYEKPMLVDLIPNSLSMSLDNPHSLTALLTKEIPAKGLILLDVFCIFIPKKVIVPIYFV